MHLRVWRDRKKRDGCYVGEMMNWSVMRVWVIDSVVFWTSFDSPTRPLPIRSHVYWKATEIEERHNDISVFFFFNCYTYEFYPPLFVAYTLRPTSFDRVFFDPLLSFRCPNSVTLLCYSFSLFSNNHHPRSQQRKTKDRESILSFVLNSNRPDKERYIPASVLFWLCHCWIRGSLEHIISRQWPLSETISTLPHTFLHHTLIIFLPYGLWI